MPDTVNRGARMIDTASDPGSYAKALRYPPYAGAMTADGEFRRGFPEPENGHRRHDAGGSEAAIDSFHGEGR